MDNNLEYLNDFKKSTERLASGLFQTVDNMRDKLTPEEQADFDAKKADIDEKMKGLKDVTQMLKDLQINIKP